MKAGLDGLSAALVRMESWRKEGMCVELIDGSSWCLLRTLRPLGLWALFLVTGF